MNWRFGFSISPPNVYSGLIFFRINWFDLLAVQGAFIYSYESDLIILMLRTWSNFPSQ